MNLEISLVKVALAKFTRSCINLLVIVKFIRYGLELIRAIKVIGRSKLGKD